MEIFKLLRERNQNRQLRRLMLGDGRSSAISARVGHVVEDATRPVALVWDMHSRCRPGLVMNIRGVALPDRFDVAWR